MERGKKKKSSTSCKNISQLPKCVVCFSQNNKEKGHSRKEPLLIANIEKEEDLSAPIILTMKQMYHDPPITNFRWKYPTTSGLILQRPLLSLSLAPSRFLFPSETREQLHGLIRDRAENISSIPCSKKSRKMSVIGKIERERKRERETEIACERVFRKVRKSIVQFIAHVPRSVSTRYNLRATQIIQRYFKISASMDELSRDVMSFVFAAQSTTRYLGNYSRQWNNSNGIKIRRVKGKYAYNYVQSSLGQSNFLRKEKKNIRNIRGTYYNFQESESEMGIIIGFEFKQDLIRIVDESLKLGYVRDTLNVLRTCNIFLDRERIKLERMDQLWIQLDLIVIKIQFGAKVQVKLD